MAMGIVDGGFGVIHMNAFLSSLNVPAVKADTVKRHERIIGPAIEKVAKESCLQAIKEEKRLTILQQQSSAGLQSVPNVHLQNEEVSQPEQGSLSVTLSLDTPEIATPPFQTPEIATSPFQTPEIATSPFHTPEPETLPFQTQERETLPFETPVTGSLRSSPIRPVKLSASFDAGWHKRGTGRAYDSLSGHASLIGHISGKVMGYATRTKRCARCSAGQRKSSHDCRQNHEGSSKSMESDMAVELVCRNEQLKQENAVISVFIGDDDCSSYAAIRREADHEVEKWSDINHASKSLNNALYKIPKMTSATVDYFSYCFGCAIKQNVNNPDGVRKSLLCIVPHAFDEHDTCGDWCGYNDDKENFKHKHLKDGKGLRGEQLKQRLTPIFEKFARNAGKLAPLGSSQANESFNRSVLSKQPKTIHYGGSESSDFRVAAAVCQKNLGTQYICKVNEEVNLSPGSHTRKYRSNLDRIREKFRVRSKSVQFKRQRKTGKKVRALRRLNTERREGITYQSESGFDATCAPTPNDSSQPLPLPSDGCLTVVIFDLETSGFGSNAEIVQIAVMHEGKEFSCYIFPLKGIPAEVSAVTKLHVESGELFYNGNTVRTTPPKIAMLRFIEYLKMCGENVLLVAHNCYRFDAAQLTQGIKKLSIWTEFTSVVRGFSDTLPLFKANLSEEVKEKLRNPETNRLSFAQTTLVENLLEPGDLDGAHNAIFDVRALCKLIDKYSLAEEILKSFKPLNFKDLDSAAKTRHDAAVKGFGAVKDKISRLMINKMVKANITLNLLTETFKVGGEASLHMLLGEHVGGKPRVTNTKSALKKITDIVAYLL